MDTVLDKVTGNKECLLYVPGNNKNNQNVL